MSENQNVRKPQRPKTKMSENLNVQKQKCPKTKMYEIKMSETPISKVQNVEDHFWTFLARHLDFGHFHFGHLDFGLFALALNRPFKTHDVSSSHLVFVRYYIIAVRPVFFIFNARSSLLVSRYNRLFLTTAKVTFLWLALHPKGFVGTMQQVM
jgi:hypothetical protein